MKRWLLFLFIPTACYANTSQPLNICSQDGTVSNYPYQLQVTPTSALTDNNNGTMLLNVGSGGGTPGGAPSQLQYNNTGAFGGVVNSTETATGPIISSGTINQFYASTATVQGSPSSSLIVNAGLAADNTDRQMIQLINANTTSGGNTQTSLDVFEQAANHVGQLKWSDYSGTSNKGIDLRIYTSLNGSLNGTAGLTLSGNYNATTGTRVGINSEAPGAILDVEGVATTGTDSNPILKLKPNNVNATGDVIDGYSHNGTLLYSISDAGNETVLDGVTATTGTFTTSITAGTTAGSGTQLYRCSGGTDAGWMLYGNSSAAATLCTGGGGSLVAESIFVP